MKRYEAIASEAGLLLNVLKRELPLLPGYALREALKKRDILVNHKRTSDNQLVNPGDELMLYSPVEAFDIPVVYEDGYCLIVNKPMGVNTDCGGRSEYSLLAWAKERAGGAYIPQLVHRLDNQTSGLVVIAKDEGSAATIKEAFKVQEVVKIYQCLVLGIPEPEAATLKAWLTKDAEKARVSVSWEKRGKAVEIITEYRTMKKGEVSRLQVTLHTGRTHQIRAHLAYLGCPVIGDEVYGDREANRLYGGTGLKLSAVELAFPEGNGVLWLSGKHFTVAPPF
jgi:23S rRNA pseudouridine955/2504/2580 synthase